MNVLLRGVVSVCILLVIVGAGVFVVHAQNFSQFLKAVTAGGNSEIVNIFQSNTNFDLTTGAGYKASSAKTYYNRVKQYILIQQDYSLMSKSVRQNAFSDDLGFTLPCIPSSENTDDTLKKLSGVTIAELNYLGERNNLKNIFGKITYTPSIFNFGNEFVLNQNSGQVSDGDGNYYTGTYTTYAKKYIQFKKLACYQLWQDTNDSYSSVLKRYLQVYDTTQQVYAKKITDATASRKSESIITKAEGVRDLACLLDIQLNGYTPSQNIPKNCVFKKTVGAIVDGLEPAEIDGVPVDLKSVKITADTKLENIYKAETRDSGNTYVLLSMYKDGFKTIDQKYTGGYVPLYVNIRTYNPKAQDAFLSTSPNITALEIAEFKKMDQNIFKVFYQVTVFL